MITHIKIENFKKIDSVEFDLSSSVVIIGPNNSGKSTVFQALCLWEIGVKKFIASFQKKDLNKQGAATLNRRDLLNSPISDARFLWKAKRENGKTHHIPMIIELRGEISGESWTCRTEFTFSNAESLSCKITNGLQQMIKLYDNYQGIHFGFLQAMSGISIMEDLLSKGAVERRLGEGKTAEVLRNICYEVLYPEIESKEGINVEQNWTLLCKSIKLMFGADLQKPEFIKSLGSISLEYIENGIRYDLSSAGRGFQQTLLLFAYMFANPNTVLLLDEPDAHLEVIRQREAFQQITQIANKSNSQILIASHSEVILNEAANESTMIALIENQAIPINVSTKNKSLAYIRKALTDIGWEQYYLARSKGHVE